MAKAKQEKYPFNDWSETPKDLDKTEDEIRETLYRKYGVDQDGDCPVNFRLIDRTKHQSMNYLPVPYPYKLKTPAEFTEIYRVLSLNLGTALREMDHFVANMNDRLGMMTFLAQHKEETS